MNLKDSVIDSFEQGSITLCSKNNFFYIFFETSASYFLCINGCGSSFCSCKDKDWINGTWNGLLLHYCDDKILATNIFSFLKINFFLINNLDRRLLADWLDYNFDSFFISSYPNLAHLFNIIIKYFSFIGLFNIYFYHSFKNSFLKKFKYILDIDIIYYDDSNLISLILPNGLEFSFNNFDYDSDYEFVSLQLLSYQSIQYIHSLSSFLNDKNNFVLFNNSYFDLFDSRILLNYFKLFSNYTRFNSFKDIFSNLQNNKSIDFFFKLYNFDIHFKNFLNFDSILQSFNQFFDIFDTWKSMTRSTKFY